MGAVAAIGGALVQGAAAKKAAAVTADRGALILHYIILIVYVTVLQR